MALLACSPPCAASCIRIARPSCRVPTIITATSHVSGFGHSVTSAMAAAMLPQACATSSMPRSELREVSRLHSWPVKTLLGSMRATAGMAAPLPAYYAWTPSGSIGGAGDDVNLGGQRPVHRALVGDLQQL